MRTVRIIAVGLMVVLAACGEGSSTTREADGKLQVAAAFYPLAEVAREVGGAHVDVVDLTPPGAEPHDLELSSTEVEAVEQADLLVVLGGGFQPALESLTDRTPSLTVLDEIGPDAGPEGDPHLWLDPIALSEVAHLVAEKLADVDQTHAEEYRANAKALEVELSALDQEIEAGLQNCESRFLVTAHEAFGWIAARYELRTEAIAGLSPEQEPDPARLDELADLVEAEGVSTVFTEALVSPRVAETLARETGVVTAVLDPLESPPAEGTYFGAMRANLQALRDGLRCP